MTYNFDTYIDRRNTNCCKWDMKPYNNPNMIPVWVADMDFASAPEILEALHKRIDHGVFGYSFEPHELNEVVINRLKNLYNWDILPEWLVWLPGLVTGFNAACRAYANKGDNIATAIPVYYPFLEAPENNFQNLQKIPMILVNNRWTLDFDAIEDTINDKTKMFMLCNPHNPGGTMFTKDKLTQFAKICEKNNLIICSDEIHCDLIIDPTKKHIPIASLSDEIAKRTITLMSPSKTFNIAGLGCSFAVISDKKLRDKYQQAIKGLVPHVNVLGYTAALAAYKHGDNWLNQLIFYLSENLKLIHEYIEKMPGFSMAKHEATYLAWLDVKQTQIKNPAKFFEKHGVGFSDGAQFDGDGFLRLNFGCSRSVLKEVLTRVYNSVVQ